MELSEVNKKLYDVLVEQGYQPPMPDDDPQSYAITLHKFVANVVAPSLNVGYPPGNWYMVTITSKPSATRDDLISSFAELQSYMAERGHIQHAVMEKSNIWHIHAMVSLNTYAKNLQRDLSRHLGVIVDVSKKVTNAKRFNGLCKYILKREYLEKGHTHDSTLIEGVIYLGPQKGYSLLPEPRDVSEKILTNFNGDEAPASHPTPPNPEGTY